jgi:geranylgeranyl diphosphate synthase type I
MDGDTERRHQPTAWTVFGIGAAILAGDALLALSQDILMETPPYGVWAARCLSAAVLRLIAGQGADLEFERRDDVEVAECLDMAGDKTAALMACACSIGVIGAHAGLSFQLVDDLLGIWGAPEVTGKPVGSDIRARKKSVPVVTALTSETPAGKDLAVLLAKPEQLKDDEVLHATKLVEAAGAKTRIEEMADAELGSALACLAEADMPEEVRAEFAAIAEFITARQW